MPETPAFSGEAFAAAFARSRQPVWVFDARTLRFLDVNAAAASFYGYSRAEFLRLTLFDVRPGRGPQRAREDIKMLLRAGVPWTGERRHRKKNGALVDVRAFSFPIAYQGRPAWVSISVQRSTVERLERAGAERRLESLLAHAPLVLFALDAKGVFTLSTGRGLAALGLEPGEVAGRSIFDVYRGQKKILADARRALRGQAFSSENETAGRAFETRWTPLREAGGRVDGVVGVSIDVTESRRLGAALRDSEQRYRNLYSRTPAMMHSIDRDGRLVSVSDLWLSTMGYRREEVIGRRSVEFLTPASRAFAREKVLPAFYRTGITVEAPYQMVKKNGEIIDVLLSASAHRDAQGRIERSLAVITDVTQRKREQEALARATALFEAIFESSPDAIGWVASTEGRFEHVNAAFARLTGYTREELKKLRIADITPREHVKTSYGPLRRMAGGGRGETYEKEYVRKDGRRVPALVTAFPVRSSGGPVGFAAVVRDLTEQKRVEKEIAETTAREQAKIGRDLHDSIGQTLTAVSLGLKALRKAAPQEGPCEAGISRLESLTRLAIQQVRDVARGLLPHELEAGDVGASLRALSNGAQKMFGVPCQVVVRGDPKLRDNSTAVQLYRIAQEALSNAAKHAHARRGVSISLDAGDKRIRLVVRDEGVGIAAGRRDAGPGLGIAIMRHRAESLGGTLVVRRARGRGTEVVCECPRPGAVR